MHWRACCRPTWSFMTRWSTLAFLPLRQAARRCGSRANGAANPRSLKKTSARSSLPWPAAAGVPFRVIPGVTAGLSGLASACIPATMRGVNQAIILATGHGPDEEGVMDWSALARTRQPIVLYMGLRNLENIAGALMRGGLPGSTPAAVIASATLAEQRVLVSTLECIASDTRAANFAAPALVVVGDIVDVRRQLLDASAQYAAAAGPPGTASPAAGAASPGESSACEG